MALYHIKTSEEFSDKVVKSDKPVLVDFFATWCGPCKMVAPELEAVAPELDGKADIVKIDVEEMPELAKEFKVMSVPTIIVMKNNEEVSRVVGFQPRAALQQMVEKAL